MAAQPIELYAAEHGEDLADVHQLPTTRNDTGVADALLAIEQAAEQLRAALTQHLDQGGQLTPQLYVLGERSTALGRGAHWQRTGRLD